MAVLRTTLLARLPFWVLIAAWFCANTPQTATWHAIVWLKDARHFSHQNELKARVAAALGGIEIEPASQWNQADASSRELPEAALPADATIKKILLSLEDSPFPAPPPSVLLFRRDTGRLCWISHVADVPHPPPRA